MAADVFDGAYLDANVNACGDTRDETKRSDRPWQISIHAPHESETGDVRQPQVYRRVSRAAHDREAQLPRINNSEIFGRRIYDRVPQQTYSHELYSEAKTTREKTLKG